MNQFARRLNDSFQPLQLHRQQPRRSPATQTALKLPRPQEPAPTRRETRRPAPYRFTPSRRQPTAQRTRQRPAPPPPPPRNPSVRLSRPYQAKTAGKLAPLPPAASTGGQMVHRQNTNPALAIHLLREIEEVVVGWQRELKQILVHVQNLYLEGPMVNGWLESDEQENGSNNGTSRLFPDRQVNYPTYQGRVSYERTRPNYRLCGRDEQGRVWSKICPPEQVSAVSMAIARYQKLCQLLKKKQGLEHRLSNIAQTLVRVHSTLKQ